VFQLVECLPSKLKALSSNPILRKEKEKQKRCLNKGPRQHLGNESEEEEVAHFLER
jgi:hypothetical protein